ncbi:hypothetical protein N8D56_01135 [Devosia sp. A8/3-2]|nr:hypothetical protein N8D56_01135 [Devosia sp. A8/3-2]
MNMVPSRAQRLLQHRSGIADDEGADGRAQDDHEFIRLKQHSHVAANGCIPTQHAADNDDDANNEAHSIRNSLSAFTEGSRRAIVDRILADAPATRLSASRQMNCISPNPRMQF